MPRTPIDYTNTYFYRIVSKDLNIKDVYVGVTTDFTRRKSDHKKICCSTNSSLNHKVYQFIRSNGGWDNFDMILIDKMSCQDSLDAKRKERAYIEQFNATLNVKTPSRSSKEWYYENKEHVLDIKKQRYEKNKDKLLSDMKEYSAINKDKISQWKHTVCICDICGREYQNSHKSSHRKSNYCVNKKLVFE